MNKKYILKYITSLFLLFVSFSQAQEVTTKDSTKTKKIEIIKSKKYFSIRFGIDLSRPVLQLIQKEDMGLEITSDFRFTKNWYIATEFGYESEPTIEEYLKFHTKGSYAKLGFNYNLYENLKGINNEIYFGIRYGFSSYQQELISFTALDLTNYFEDHYAAQNEVYKGLTAHWAELHFGLKVETLPNLFLTADVQFKKLLSNEESITLNHLYIPGMGTTLLSKNAIGFNYTLSYNIPLAKNRKK